MTTERKARMARMLKLQDVLEKGVGQKTHTMMLVMVTTAFGIVAAEIVGLKAEIEAEES